eukprot:CAMPEP_0177733964 /NCGR_PEP_ID=MMETSP0484_2-20121128/23971_1 /TAXON_ID=354590 /ORGANISM="Rhodomonas lens, Strain RHODO" /LENGTH=76 /DNA_ID=CAMNT_0019247391 /DNA_START=30 /DNA_END=257 /DNA_ORIENTATION=+
MAASRLGRGLGGEAPCRASACTRTPLRRDARRAHRACACSERTCARALSARALIHGAMLLQLVREEEPGGGRGRGS